MPMADRDIIWSKISAMEKHLGRDIAAHIVSEEGLGVAGSTNELFYLLED
jgi:hypothetical protein